MKTILHIIDTLGVGGAEVLLQSTLPLLPEYNHIVCYLNEPSTLEKDIRPFAKVILLRHTGNLGILQTAIRLRRILRQNNVDIIHAHLIKSTWIARLANDGRRFIFTIHNVLSVDAFNANRLSLIVEKLTYSRKQEIVSVSQVALSDYNKHIGIKGRAEVIYNFVNEEFFLRQKKREMGVRSDLYLVSVGNLKPQKNYLRLLKAIATIKSYPVFLDIYGSGPLHNELQEFIDREAINVRLMGRGSDIATILQKYDAYILPSIYEGFGIAPLEAMAVGLPILLSDLDVFREVFEDKPFYFDPLNIASISDALVYVFENWKDIEDRSLQNREFIKGKASAGLYKKKLLELYNR